MLRRDSQLAFWIGLALLAAAGCGGASHEEDTSPATTANEAGSRVRMGLALVQEGHVDAAMEQFRKLREEGGESFDRRPEPVWAPQLLRQLLRRHEADLADSLLAATGPLKERSPELRYLTANLRALQGRDAQAFEAYRSVEDQERWARRAHHEMATLYLKEGNTEQALIEADHALKLAPEDAALHLLKAEALRRAGQPEEALAECRKVAPGSKRWVMEGEILLDDFDRPDTASTLFDRALSQTPAIPNVRFLLGRSLLAAGKAARARKALEPLAKLVPPFPESREQLELCYRRLGLDEKADSLQRKIDEVARDTRWRTIRAQGVEQSVAGDLEDALKSFDSALKIAPDEANLHNDRGAVLARMERWKEAEQEFLEAARLDPTDPTFQENLARLYHRTGDEARQEAAIARYRALVAADSVAKVDKP